MKRIAITLSLIMCLGGLSGCKSDNVENSNIKSENNKVEEKKSSIENFTKEYEDELNSNVIKEDGCHIQLQLTEDKKRVIASIITDQHFTPDERRSNVYLIEENRDNYASKIIELFNNIYNKYKDNGYKIYEVLYLIDGDNYTLLNIESDSELDVSYITGGNDYNEPQEDTRYQDLCNALASFGDKYDTVPQIEVDGNGILIWMYLNSEVAAYVEEEGFSDNSEINKEFLEVWSICKGFYGDDCGLTIAWVNPDGNLVLRNCSRFYE